jgi:ABC-type phosphate transport system ATPase subunit
LKNRFQSLPFKCDLQRYIAECTQRSVRVNIGIVPQDCVLFNDTIEYNIAFGKLGNNAMGTMAEVEKAAKAAQFSTFVNEQCKEGYQTLVGERGLRLSGRRVGYHFSPRALLLCVKTFGSHHVIVVRPCNKSEIQLPGVSHPTLLRGGEKQRVAIARALLKDPPIMIYDEATSSLDTHTEKEIMLSINEAAKGRTNVVIAHRLSTIMDAHCIIVLKEGTVGERGDHATLYADTGGLYRGMWDQQLQSVEEAAAAGGGGGGGGEGGVLTTPGAAAAAAAGSVARVASVVAVAGTADVVGAGAGVGAVAGASAGAGAGASAGGGGGKLAGVAGGAEEGGTSAAIAQDAILMAMVTPPVGLCRLNQVDPYPITYSLSNP